ncbi:MAG: hypothetical protein QM490_06265, partial [Candidatus Gracilibacteria bacterium]
MGLYDGYKGSEDIDNLGGIQDVSQSFESKNNGVESEPKSVKDELSSLKEEMSGNDIQLNNKVDETIDILKEQLGKKLSEEEKDKILKAKKAQIDEIVSRNAEEAKNVDEKKKDTLKYLKSIGFDLLPQSLT